MLETPSWLILSQKKNSKLRGKYILVTCSAKSAKKWSHLKVEYSINYENQLLQV